MLSLVQVNPSVAYAPPPFRQGRLIGEPKRRAGQTTCFFFLPFSPCRPCSNDLCVYGHLWRTLICIGADRRRWRMQGGGDGAKQGARGRAQQALYGKAAEWHSLPSSKGVTVYFYSLYVKINVKTGDNPPMKEKSL